MVYIEKNGFNEIFQYIVDKLQNYQNQMSFMYISFALKSNKLKVNQIGCIFLVNVLLDIFSQINHRDNQHNFLLHYVQSRCFSPLFE